MRTFDLAGAWTLTRDDGDQIAGHLPGSTYLDYMAAGMSDPFEEMNENEATKLAHHDFTYARTFTLPEEAFSFRHLVLVGDGLDTICTIYLNGQKIAYTNNINRTWRIDIKEAAKAGENEIRLEISDPYRYIKAAQTVDPMPMPSMPIAGAGHIRKTVCNFGWDWGPALAPAGVTRRIAIEAYDGRIAETKIRQIHEDGSVTLKTCLLTEDLAEGETIVKLIHPSGKEEIFTAPLKDGLCELDIPVSDPQLWWCNGLGAQPLYQVIFSVGGDEKRLQVGLRTIELDTSPDVHGRQFRFLINKVPIFARGANWIPADSFITRVDEETMDFYMSETAKAGMNMLRVWGGGLYETEMFYDACDRYGILVWQDFLFCDNAYPFYQPEFLENIHQEVIDNVRRLRHRASLAVWSGNNENEMMRGAWKRNKRVYETNHRFYHETLKEWTLSLDGERPYWPGSPSSGKIDEKVHNLKEGQVSGDTHLWQIWHGMRPIEAFREFPTRFCSEFGMESMPSPATIRSFTKKPDLKLFDPVMMLHQKSSGGNEKILFYLLAKYRNPKKFSDFIYLSQLVQADTIRFATECWRRNMGQQNGSLFWQLNDCWPVASWAGIDYGRQLKAVMYSARHFNKMISVSNDYFDDRAELYLSNDFPAPFEGTLNWELVTFDGEKISDGQIPVSAKAVSSSKIMVLSYADALAGKDQADAALHVTLLREGEVVDEKSWLLLEDKAARLPKAAPQYTYEIKDGALELTLSSSVYARYVEVSAEGITAPWSDNYFDLLPGVEKKICVPLPAEGIDEAGLEKAIRIRSLTDVESEGTPASDKLLRAQMVLKNNNYLSWVVFKFLL